MNTSEKNKYLTEGLVLAGIPVLAYLITFSYQAGYAIYFDIPRQLISLNLITIIISLFFIITSLASVYVISNAVWIFTPKGDDPLSVSIRRFVVFAIIGLFLIAPFLPSYIAWAMYASILVILGISEFIFPLLTQRNKAAYSDKLAAQSEVEYEAGKNLLWHQIDKRIGRWLVTATIYSGIALGLSFGIGMKKAENNTSYYITLDNAVVLAIYGDLAVLSKYDSNNLTLSDELFFEKVGEGRTKSLRSKKIGQLKLAKK